MPNATQNSRRAEGAFAREDAFGMFEAGLAELAAHFDFDAANTPEGVTLTIRGLERVEHPDGTWGLRIREA